MKNLWKKAKQGATIAVGKITSTPESEDPEFLQRNEIFRTIETQALDLEKRMEAWALSIELESQANVALSSTFAKAFGEGEEPYCAEAWHSQLGIARLAEGYRNLKETHIPHFCLAKLAEFRGRIMQLKKARSQRVDNRILMQSEEKDLKQAQEKHKDVPHRQERFDAQQAEYLKFHNQFITGVDELVRDKPEVFGKVYHIYQFYLMELVELQQSAIVSENSSIPFAQFKHEFPSALTKMELKPLEIVIKPAEEAEGEGPGVE
jgi:hypothetical protein